MEKIESDIRNLCIDRGIVLMSSPLQNLKKEELKIFLKDILEDEVDEKYYLSEKQMSNLIKNGNWNCNPSGKGMNGKIHRGNVSPTLTTNKGEGSKIIIPKRLFGIFDKNGKKRQAGAVWDKESISPTLDTMQRGWRQPSILSQPLKFLNRNQKNLQGEYSGCVDSCNTNGVRINNTIRKLTPTECFRLMGFLDDEIKLEGLSNTQKYKLAGNGWDINLVSKIFKEMFKNEKRN